MIEGKIWFITGMEHILDFHGYDHLLFLTLLVFSNPLNQWKSLFFLITAFTCGHTVTLALCTLNVFQLQQSYTELLIVCTIAFTAAYEFIWCENTANRGKIYYLIICCFGFIHGMGFSYLLKSMLGHEENSLVPLLFFNLGLEAGQIIFVLLLVIGLLFVHQNFRINQMKMKNTIITLLFLVAATLCYTRVLIILNE